MEQHQEYRIYEKLIDNEWEQIIGKIKTLSNVEYRLFILYEHAIF